MVRRQFHVHVENTEVYLGNSALIKCAIPEYVRPYVRVASWHRGEEILLPDLSDVGECCHILTGGEFIGSWNLCANDSVLLLASNETALFAAAFRAGGWRQRGGWHLLANVAYTQRVPGVEFWFFLAFVIYVTWVYDFRTAGRYVVLAASGDLYVRSVRSEDGLMKFSCLVTNTLNGERQRSDAVMLQVKGEFQKVFAQELK